MLDLSQSKFWRATQCQNTGRPPIWLMRQAGRYMPQYQKIRKKHGFLDMIYTPEIACEITLQPIDFFGFDAAILFSDILVLSSALGRPVQFIENVGPVIENPIRSIQDANQLDAKNALEKLSPILQTIRLLRPELDARQCPLIGFSGAPFTVASYMIEGKSSPTLSITKQLLYTDPDGVHALLEKLTIATIDYLQAQIDAGVHALQLFDTWACHLSWHEYQTFSIPYLTRIIASLKRPKTLPILLFAKNSTALSPLLVSTGADGLSIDMTGHLPLLRSQYPRHILQGNLDPMALTLPHDNLIKIVRTILGEMRNDPGYIFNLGHGITPNISPNTIKVLVDTVKAFH